MVVGLGNDARPCDVYNPNEGLHQGWEIWWGMMCCAISKG